MTRTTPARRVPAPRFRLEHLEPRDVPATFTWSGADAINSNWSDGDNWVGGVAPSGSAVTLDDLVFPAGAAQLANTNDLAGATFHSIQFTGSGYVLSGNALTLGTAAAAGSGFVLADTGTTNNQLITPVVLGAAATTQTVTVSAGADLTVDAPVGGTPGLTKVGAGTLILQAANTYAGATAVSAGTLVVKNAGTLGVADGTPATGTTVAAGASLVADGANIGNETLTVGDTGGSGEFNFRSGASWAGPVTLANDLTTGVGTSGSDALTLTGAVGGPGALTKTGAGQLTLGGTAANTYGGVTTVNGGFLLLNKTPGVNAVPSAGLAVSGGAVVRHQQNDQLADAAPVAVTGGAFLDLDGRSDAVGPLTLGSTTGSDEAFVSTGAGTLRLTGDVTRVVSATAPGTAQITGQIDLNGATRTFAVPDGAAPMAELFVSAAVVGVGGLTKTGAGTLQFGGTAANTFAGLTAVTGGTLQLIKSDNTTAVPGALAVGAGATVEVFGANLIADAAAVTVGAGGLLFLNGDPETIAELTVAGGTVTMAGTGVLTVAGPVTLQGATVSGGTLAPGGTVTVLAGAGASTVTSRIDLGGATRTFDVADAGAGDDLTLGNVIQGTGGLTKTGPGTLMLGVVSTYTGPTTVNAGTLRVVGSIAPSAVALAGGTLGGSGTVGVVAATGGTLAPSGTGPTTTLTTAGVSLGAGSVLAPVISDAMGGVADLVRVTGTVTLTGATLSPTVVGTTPTGARSFRLIDNDGADAVVGTFAGLPQGATVTLGGVPFTIRYNGNDGNDVVLVPAMSPPPPPTTDLGPVRPVAVGGATDGSVRLVNAAQTVTAAPFGNTGTATRTAMADVDGDGVADLIAVTGPGTPLRVAVLSGATGQFLVQPFDPFGGDFRGGGYVSAADLDGDGRAEFAVTPDEGGGPRVTLFSRAADGTRTTRANFFGIDDANFRGGARAALGDVDGDDTPDVVVAAGFGGGPRTAVFNGQTVLAGNPTRLVADFFAFPGADAVNLRNGSFVAAGDVTGDGFADLIFGGGPGGAPRVFILSGALVSAGNVAGAQAAPVANFFVAGDLTDRGGARVAVTNADGDAKADVAVGSGAGRPARVRLYLGKDFAGGGEPAAFTDLTPFDGAVLAAGVFVG